LKQFILSNKPESVPDKENTVRLKGDDYRYLIHVRRLAVGEIFPALLPDNTEVLIRILSIDKSKNTLIGKCIAPEDLTEDTENSEKDSASSSPQIILFQAMPKGDKMDLIVRQAAESGIAEIVPFISEYSIAKVNAESHKFTRWEKIIKEARQQSGSKTATALHKPLSLSELFVYWEKINLAKTTGILFHHVPVRGLEQKSLHGYLNNDPKTIVLVIGPEGGFSDKEVSLFQENNFLPLTIGDTILRTETAAIYCTAAIRIILLEKNSWELKQKKTGSV